jgi:hypothetical protein
MDQETAKTITTVRSERAPFKHKNTKSTTGFFFVPDSRDDMKETSDKFVAKKSGRA